MELLFNNQHVHKVVVPRYYDPKAVSTTTTNDNPPPVPTPTMGKTTDIKFLIWWLKEYLLVDKARPELFSQGETMSVGDPGPASPPNLD